MVSINWNENRLHGGMNYRFIAQLVSLICNSRSGQPTQRSFKLGNLASPHWIFKRLLEGHAWVCRLFVMTSGSCQGAELVFDQLNFYSRQRVSISFFVLSVYGLAQMRTSLQEVVRVSLLQIFLVKSANLNGIVYWLPEDCLVTWHTKQLSSVSMRFWAGHKLSS